MKCGTGRPSTRDIIQLSIAAVPILHGALSFMGCPTKLSRGETAMPPKRRESSVFICRGFAMGLEDSALIRSVRQLSRLIVTGEKNVKVDDVHETDIIERDTVLAKRVCHGLREFQQSLRNRKEIEDRSGKSPRQRRLIPSDRPCQPSRSLLPPLAASYFITSIFLTH